MYNDLYDRTQMFAFYIVENKSTIRACAKHFGIAKSTVHYDLHSKLPIINKGLYKQLETVLNKNFTEKHLRGGEATRLKYLKNN